MEDVGLVGVLDRELEGRENEIQSQTLHGTAIDAYCIYGSPMECLGVVSTCQIANRIFGVTCLECVGTWLLWSSVAYKMFQETLMEVQ